MCAKRVKEEYGEEPCRPEEEIERQRQRDARLSEPPDVLHTAGLFTAYFAFSTIVFFSSFYLKRRLVDIKIADVHLIALFTLSN